jgi:hypothetical protein
LSFRKAGFLHFFFYKGLKLLQLQEAEVRVQLFMLASKGQDLHQIHILIGVYENASYI